MALILDNLQSERLGKAFGCMRIRKRSARFAVAALCFALYSAISWIALSDMALAGNSPQGDSQYESEADSQAEDPPVDSPRAMKRPQDRALSAQSTAGYSRLRPSRKREFDTVRPEPIHPPRRPSEDTGEIQESDPGSGSGPGKRDELDLDDSTERPPPSTPRPARRPPRSSAQTHSSGNAESGPETASLVADDGGPVAELLLHYSVTSEPELGQIYHDLFQHLGHTVRLQVCCPNDQSADAFASRWGAAAVGQGRSVHVVNVNRPITVWARDRRICRQTADSHPASCFVPVAHSTYDPEKQNDLVLPSMLWSTGLVPSVALTSLHLEGGNVVSNRRHVFVGSNAFEDNEHRFESEEGLFSELGRMFGRTTIAIQGQDGDVPWIHTDMYLTPIDSKTVLVASPVLGCDLLPNRKTIPAINRGKPVNIEFDQVSTDSARQQRFDDVANQLTELGYQVIRLPSLVNIQKDWMVTYNNVIMDYQSGQRVVYMPVYNIPELDQAAEQTYRALGFDVKPIDVSAIFQLGGAIRCLANVTRRLPFETRLQTREPEGNGRLQVYSVDPSANRARPRREKRPAQNISRERPDQPSQGHSVAGQSMFGQTFREQPARDMFEQPAPMKERPMFERPEPINRQPIESDSSGYSESPLRPLTRE